MATDNKTKKNNYLGNAIVIPNIKSYADDPFFVKKSEQAKKTLERVGLPESIKTKKPSI